MPQDPYADFGAPIQPGAKADPYADFGAPVKAAAPVTKATPAPAQPSAMNVLTQPTDKTDKEYLGYTGLPGVLGATIHGLNSVARDTVGAVKGAWDTITKPPQGTGENVVNALGPGALPAYRGIKPIIDAATRAPEIPAALRDINSSPDPITHYANAAEDTASQGAGQALTAVASDFAGKGISKLGPKPLNADIVSDTYSKPGDHLSASLRSNTKVDVPAESKIAAPAIEEGLKDRGIITKDFQGRNGPAALQAGIDNAIDIHEARAKHVIDPIRGEAVDPQTLSKNPELAARFADKDGNITKSVSYGDLDAERIKINKELRTGNYYGKAPSAQYAAADPLAAAHEAANQVRDLVYDKAQATTGVDLRPLKRTESALIKLGDLAETTKNTLSAKAAQHAVTSLPKKILGTVQGALSVKANPINAFSIPEKSGLFSPTNEFNSHMQKAFPNLKATTADRTVAFPNYKLNLTSPGSMPSPLQRILNLSGGEQVPGENLKLTAPEGKTPPAPNAQEPLEFEGGQNIPAAATPDILGRGLIGGDMPLTSSGDMPAALQRVLPFQQPGLPSELYPGTKHVPKVKK